jgi:hypothetical protein
MHQTSNPGDGAGAVTRCSTGIGSHPLACRPGAPDAVNARPFTDPNGTRYLLYSANRQGDATLCLQRLNAYGAATISQRRTMIRVDRADEDHIMEAPTMVATATTAGDLHKSH